MPNTINLTPTNSLGTNPVVNITPSLSLPTSSATPPTTQTATSTPATNTGINTAGAPGGQILPMNQNPNQAVSNTSPNTSQNAVTIPGTGQNLTQLQPLSNQDVMNLLAAYQKFPQAFKGGTFDSSLSSQPNFTGTLESSPNNAQTQQLQDQVHQTALSMGVSEDQLPALDSIIQAESGWNPSAKNPTSSASGLFQFLNTTDQNYGITPTSSLQDQIKAGIQYIQQRYGNPANAWAFHVANGWY